MRVRPQLLPCGYRNHTQVLRLDSKYLYPVRHLALCHLFHFVHQINSYIHITTKHPRNKQYSFVTLNWNPLHWRFCLILHGKHFVKVPKLFPLRKLIIKFQYECHLFYQCNSVGMTTFCLVQLLLLDTLTSYLLTIFSNPNTHDYGSFLHSVSIKGGEASLWTIILSLLPLYVFCWVVSFECCINANHLYFMHSIMVCPNFCI